MDTSTVTISVVVVFALIAIIGFVVYRQRGEAEIKILGMSLKIKGSNEIPSLRPTISAKNITSREGGFMADDGTGHGIAIEQVNVKDDVLLSSNPPSIPSSSRNSSEPSPLNSLSAQALSAGGNITIQQFVGNQTSPQQQFEFFIKHIGAEDYRTSNFANSQFQAYCNVWKSLQALRLAGDDLWNQATDNNLVIFAEQLRKTRTIALEGEIFFDDEDRESLKDIFSEFGLYRIGKMRLEDIRSKYEIYSEQEIKTQIEINSKYKTRYENLLDKIRVSFRTRISCL